MSLYIVIYDLYNIHTNCASGVSDWAAANQGWC